MRFTRREWTRCSRISLAWRKACRSPRQGFRSCRTSPASACGRRGAGHAGVLGASRARDGAVRGWGAVVVCGGCAELLGARPRRGAQRDGAGVLAARRTPTLATGAARRRRLPRPHGGGAEGGAAGGAVAGRRCLGGAVDARSVAVDWAAMLRESGARRVELPTYAFQRRRYWMEGAPSRSGRGWGWRYEGPVEADRAPAGVWRSGTWLAILPAAAHEDPWVSTLVDAIEARGAKLVRVPLDGVAAVA